MREFTERPSRDIQVLGWCLSILLIITAAGCRKETPPAPEPNEPAPSAVAELQAPSETAATDAPPADVPEPVPAVPEPDVVLVTVDGQEITEKQLAAAMDVQVRRAGPRLAGLPPQLLEQFKKQIRPQVLDSLIAERLLNTQIESANIVVTNEEVTAAIEAQGARLSPPKNLDEIKAILLARGMSFEEAMEQYRAGLSRQRLLETQWAGKLDVNDADAKTYYDQNTKEFESPEQVRASHILIKPQVTDPNSDPNVAKVAARAKAEKLVGEIKDGADFAELAKANPGDPGSAAKGGDLGFFSRGRMVKPFEEAAFAMQPGEVSDIVESRFGYHIIKVTERKEASVKPFEEAKAGIVTKLTDEQKAKISKAYIESLKAKATIVYAETGEPNAPKPAPEVFATPADANAN